MAGLLDRIEGLSVSLHINIHTALKRHHMAVSMTQARRKEGITNMMRRHQLAAPRTECRGKQLCNDRCVVSPQLPPDSTDADLRLLLKTPCCSPSHSKTWLLPRGNCGQLCGALCRWLSPNPFTESMTWKNTKLRLRALSQQ